MKFRLNSGAFSAFIGLVGTGVAMAYPEQKWFGLVTIAIAVLSFIFNIRIEGNQVKLDGQWVRRKHMLLIVGMIVGATLFLGCTIAFFFKPKGDPLDETILVECEWGKLPNVIPPEGVIYLMQINEPLAPQTIGLGKIPGKPGDKYNSWIVKENMAYRCRIKNYGEKPVFHLGMTFAVDYKAVVKHQNGGGGSRESTGQKAEYPIVIPDIPTGGTLDFYAYNVSTLYALITVPTTATLKQLGSDDWHTVKLRVVVNGAFFLQPHIWNLKEEK